MMEQEKLATLWQHLRGKPRMKGLDGYTRLNDDYTYVAKDLVAWAQENPDLENLLGKELYLDLVAIDPVAEKSLVNDRRFYDIRDDIIMSLKDKNLLACYCPTLSPTEINRENHWHDKDEQHTSMYYMDEIAKQETAEYFNDRLQKCRICHKHWLSFAFYSDEDSASPEGSNDWLKLLTDAEVEDIFRCDRWPVYFAELKKEYGLVLKKTM